MVGHRKSWRSIVAAIVMVALLMPVRVSFAATNTFANPKYKMLILTVAMLNKAMQDAANNPMDEWRRANVQRAIQLLPPALIALAGEYQNGNLDGHDFQQAYKVVAMFVDQAAADGYKKFLNKPDRNFIPALPANFPKVEAPSVPGGLTGPSGSGSGGRERLAIDESRSAQGIASVDAPKNAALSSELVNLSAVRPSSGSMPAAREKLRFDENATADTGVARVEASAPSNTGRTAAEAAPAWQSSSPAVREAQRDLSKIEQRVGSTDLTIRTDSGRTPAGVRASEEEREEAKDEKVLESVGADSEKEAKEGRKPRVRKSLKEGKKTSAIDRVFHWSLRLAESTILPGRAFAEEGGGGEAAQFASAMLFGAAAVIGAIAPIIVANTQAKADKAIARMNADTQKYLADQTAGTSKYLADQQKDIAFFQSNLARTIASEQQQNVNYRLDRQLAELKEARKDAEAVQTAIRNKEWEYNERRLKIAEDQAQKNFELAQEALKSQLTASGLSSGFANSFDSGNQLTTSTSITPLGGVGGSGQASSNSVASAGTSGASGSSGQGASGASAAGSRLAANESSAGSTSASSGASGATGLASANARGASSEGLGNGSARAAAGGVNMLASAGKSDGGSLLDGKESKSAFERLVRGVGARTPGEDGDETFEDEVDGRKHGKGKLDRRRRGLASLRMATKLTKDGKPVVEAPIAKATGKSSDLIKFFGDGKATTFATEPAPEAPKAN